MEFSFRHSMRGRIRLNIPALCRSRSLSETFLAWLSAQSGVRSARINYDCASLVLEYDPAQETMLRLMLDRFRGASLADIKALCAGAATEGIAARPPEVSKRSPLALPTLSLLMAFSANPVVMALNMPLMFYNAIPIAKRAWKVWANESRLNIDVLDTLAITSSVLQGNPMAGCIVTWLIKLGDWIRDLTAAGQKRAISELLEFQTKTAWVLRDDQVVQVPAAELAVGDLVVVYPGEMIPVDGEIIEGQATIDQKTITGEGLPVNRGKGEAAFAATVIREGQITVRALRVGSATTAGQIVHLVESAPIGDTRMQNHAERFADRLVAPTLALAAGTAAVTATSTVFSRL
jgi:cation transport ATPase